MSQPQQPKRNFNRVVRGGSWLKPKKWEDWTPGDFVSGVLVECNETDLYSKPIWLLKVEDKKITGQDPTILSGENAGCMPLYSNGGVTYALEQANAQPGDAVRFTYNGMAKTSGKNNKFKGKPCHDVTVEVDGFVPEDGGEEVPTSDNDLLG